jgi:nucleotide-binding universal stress UspA family protein
VYDRLRSILVATDFSSGAARALARAVRLPCASIAKLAIVHVAPAGIDDAARAVAIEQLRAAVGSVPARDGLSVESELVHGDAYAQIIAQARARDCDLVVIGRHGRRAIRDLFIGSTATRVVRYGDCAVLVVNGEVHESYKRPLVAVDLQDSSLKVIELALSVLDAQVPHVEVMHAYHIPFEGLQYVARTSRLERELEAEARASLARATQAADAPHVRWLPVIRRGDARSAILAEIATRHCDLAALGTHGRAGLAHVVLGSVAEHVVASAACDVLVARPTRFTFAMP